MQFSLQKRGCLLLASVSLLTVVDTKELATVVSRSEENKGGLIGYSEVDNARFKFPIGSNNSS